MATHLRALVSAGLSLNQVLSYLHPFFTPERIARLRHTNSFFRVRPAGQPFIYAIGYDWSRAKFRIVCQTLASQQGSLLFNYWASEEDLNQQHQAYLQSRAINISRLRS